MANQKAYTFEIIPKNSVNEQENSTVHQSSPTWVLTFVRWEFRDTLRTRTQSPNTVRPPLVVENDCLAVNTTDDKGSLTPSCQITLVETDVNYSTQISPGDFIFVNMLNWERDSRRVADAARAMSPINGPKDGFKGIYKVQSVRKFINTDPSNGAKTVMYRVDGFAFTEFNNTLYFNPNLVNQKDLENQALFIENVATAWASYVSRDGKPFVQEILSFFIQNFIGASQNPDSLSTNGMVISPNVRFSVPTTVGRLLGVTKSRKPDGTDYKTVTAAKDIFRYLFGIQQYATGKGLTMATGMNPFNVNYKKQRYPGFDYTSEFCGGNTLLKAEYWNQVKLWSAMNQYTNSPLNELYTTFKIDVNNRIMPTVIFRQIPFTSEDFAGQKLGVKDIDAQFNTIPVTKFLNLPRWKIDSSFILNMDIGKDEAARINWVQYYARSSFNDKGLEVAGETAIGNYVYDKDDIVRSGLRPYIVQNQFDDLPDRLVMLAPQWARVLGDALIGGHLKLNGTFNCIGIVEPIAVGDNLEVDGVVYHIENVTHACSINPMNGVKIFRTSIKASHGVSVNSNTEGTKYAEMTYTSGYADRAHDFKNEQILPGISESQDVIYRPAQLDPTKKEADASRFNPFPQPSLKKNVTSKGE